MGVGVEGMLVNGKGREVVDSVIEDCALADVFKVRTILRSGVAGVEGSRRERVIPDFIAAGRAPIVGGVL
ncbi:hypothetical protein AN958_04239 [Leucoagaricus sp. SymC.cos]|nr:hypothetical protein AN958_04239 [Leucoagaricus sp. SymC.cos]